MKDLSDYWDGVIGGIKNYHLNSDVAKYKREEHINLLKKWAGDLVGKTVLKTDLFEEALGKDYFFDYLMKNSKNAIGMDISNEIIKKAKKRFKSKNYVTSDVRKPPFKDNSFDLIISNSTLDHLPKEEMITSLIELRRILKPKGALILTLDNKTNPLYHAGYLIQKLINNRLRQVRCYSISEAKKIVEDVGFFVEETTAIVHLPTPFNKIALLLERLNIKQINNLIKRSIKILRKVERKKTRYLTGWFVALKCIKKKG